MNPIIIVLAVLSAILIVSNIIQGRRIVKKNEELEAECRAKGIDPSTIKMEDEQKGIEMGKENKSIDKAIKVLAKDGWIGFKFTKHERGAPMVKVFSPGNNEAGSIIPTPENIIGAGETIEWMQCPSDNISGVAKTEEEKKIKEKYRKLRGE